MTITFLSNFSNSVIPATFHLIFIQLDATSASLFSQLTNLFLRLAVFSAAFVVSLPWRKFVSLTPLSFLLVSVNCSPRQCSMSMLHTPTAYDNQQHSLSAGGSLFDASRGCQSGEHYLQRNCARRIVTTLTMVNTPFITNTLHS